MDARAELERLIGERGEDYAGLSRLIGRNAAYVQQYIKRGIPKRLAEGDRRLLARYFEVPEEQLGGPAPDPGREPDHVVVPRLDFASSRMSDLIAPVFPRARLGVDGLLGVDVLGDYRLVFDMAGERVSLLRSPRVAYVQQMDVDISRLNRANELRGHREYGQLTVTDVAADGVDVTAFIDSGAQHSIGNMALFNSLAVQRPSLRDQVWETPIIGVTGQTTTGRLAYLRSLRLGSARVHDLPVLFADLHAFDIWRLTETPALLMGADILGMFRNVTMDYGQMRMVFGSRLDRR